MAPKSSINPRADSNSPDPSVDELIQEFTIENDHVCDLLPGGLVDALDALDATGEQRGPQDMIAHELLFPDEPDDE